jgi:hypothetical protein
LSEVPKLISLYSIVLNYISISAIIFSTTCNVLHYSKTQIAAAYAGGCVGVGGAIAAAAAAASGGEGDAGGGGMNPPTPPPPPAAASGGEGDVIFCIVILA